MGHGRCGPPATRISLVEVGLGHPYLTLWEVVTRSPTPPKEGGVGHPVQEFIVN